MSINEMLFIAVIFLANVVEAITGFAGTMLAMPAGIYLLDISTSKVVLNLIALYVSSSIMYTNRNKIDTKEVVNITYKMAIGMLIGFSIFAYFPVEQLVLTYGIFLITFASLKLAIKKNVELSPLMLNFVLLLAGLIHGLFLSGGSLLVIYAINILKDKDIIRATLAPVWLILNFIILLNDIIFKRITFKVFIMFLICIPIISLSIIIGNKIHKKISQDIFIKLTYVLLIISGIILII